MTQIRFNGRVENDRVVGAVYAGERGERLRKCGEIVLDVEHWQLLGLAILLGSDNPNLKRHLEVEWEDPPAWDLKRLAAVNGRVDCAAGDQMITIQHAIEMSQEDP